MRARSCCFYVKNGRVHDEWRHFRSDNSEKTLFHLFWTEEGLLFDGGAVLG